MAGKDLKGEKRVHLALADLKGVNSAFARAVSYAANVDPFEKLGNLNGEQLESLQKVLKDPAGHGIPSWMLNRRKDYETGRDLHLVGVEVTMAQRGDIGRERRIRSRRGIRHELGLPVRGQRTRTTGRRGLTVGVMRKEVRIREAEAKAKKGKETREGEAKAKKEKRRVEEKK